MTKKTAQQGSINQQDYVKRMRAESFLHRGVPLGFPNQNPTVEIGPSATAYYKQKFLRGERSEYWGLHRVADQTFYPAR